MATQTYTDGVTLSSAAEFDRFDTAAYPVLTSVAGTNTVTATGPANYALSSSMPPIVLIPANTNTGATTLAVTPSGSSALTAKSIFHNGAACIGGELIAGVPVILEYDGTQFNVCGRDSIIMGTSTATTSGTTKTVSGIPAWVKKITLNFVGVSLNGNTSLIIQIGDAGGIENSGYSGAGFQGSGSGSTAATQFSTSWNTTSATAASVYHGTLVISLENPSSNTWAISGVLGRSDAATIDVIAGSKSTSAALDRVLIGSGDATSTFDAGEWNLQFQ